MKNNTREETAPNGKTTILLTNRTRDLLKKLGKKGETYDKILINLLEEKEKKNE